MAASPERGHMLLSQGPNYGTTPRAKTWTNDRRDKLKRATPRSNAAVQQQHQAERNWRKRLVEGRLSPKEQRMVALMADLDLLRTTDAEAAGTNETEPGSTANQETETVASSDREADGSQWSLLKRRQRGAETESATENARDLNRSDTITTSTEKWPLLNRREPSYGYMEPVDTPLDDSRQSEAIPLDDSRELVTAPPEDSMDLVAATREALAKKENVTVSKSHTMIRIDGLSTNVHASDFYRIAETDLSKWNQSIKKVQQVRDGMTLEPTGTYHITFSTAMAATAYAARFQRLHALAQIKARSRTGLWRSEVPPTLLPPDREGGAATAQESLEAELAQLSIAPGVQDVALEHRRVAAGPEGHKIRSLHGQRARGSWGLARAHPVAGNLHQQLQRLAASLAAAKTAQQDAEHDNDDDGVQVEVDEAQRQEAEKQRRATLRKREGLRRVAQHMEGAALRRFVVAFRDVAEAQRFHRLWNGRWLGGYDTPPPPGAPRHFVRTQVVEY
ncbi:hypothetical protein LEL_06672 [Akanthomyces lecanii RCEF 1005]|uniref:Uncharacterized protein n=1 Tax=Akanthomyces lecanii RCEF 1005 TaxID=1081108 RepID=A0A162KM63_CORDF|nr:hypothetical protein LEL_06672 [Akanthomyces lecanii RCEF 1005]